jgi:putative oxidoreductase
MKDISDLMGRILLGAIFLYEALDTLIFYENTKNTMTNYGITAAQDFLIIVSIIILLFGSILIIIGYFARIGAGLLFIYWFILTMIIYSFWDDPTELQRINGINFMRNMAICGGLLMLLANGAGKYSVKRLIHVMKLPE